MDRNTVSETLPSGLDEGLFDLMGYLLTSARGLLDEPAEYGPFRLMEAVSRLCGLMAEGGSRHEEFLRRMQRTVDAGKLSLMTDPQAFTLLLDQAVIEYTRRLKQA
jgi:hypothetical protein